MVDQCSLCERVWFRGEWFECGLIYFKPHETRQTVCGDCASQCEAAASSEACDASGEDSNSRDHGAPERLAHAHSK
jgi:hypothetical protein